VDRVLSPVRSGAVDDVSLVRVRGRELRVAVRRPDRPTTRTPLLLMNGIGAGLEFLQPLVDRLPPELEVIRFDVPGIGGSPLPLVPYHMWTLAPLIGELVRRLGHEQVDVLGFSWGGGLAQQFAVTSRRRCRRLVLAATSTGSLMVPGRPEVVARFLTPEPDVDAATALRLAGELYGGTVRNPGAATVEVLDLLGRTLHDSRRGYVYQLLAGAGWNTLPALGLIRQPTLIVAGEDDPIIPTVNATILHRGIPGSRLLLHPGGHLALVTEAAEIAPEVDRFLSGPA
jgi:poly(3-hydroxyalkanoate) depolymerase